MRLTRRRPTLPRSIIFATSWRRRVFSTVVVAGIALALVCSRSADRPVRGNDQARYHDRSFRVVNVVDGDTFDLDVPDARKRVTRVRLWGVDTPEVGHGREASMHFGSEAAAFARETLVGRDVHVVLSPKRTRGKYGRLLGYVFLQRGGRMFNEMLLEEGYAYADLRFDHHYYKRFQKIEKEARKTGIGLWANVTFDKMPAWKQRFERKATNDGD